MRQKRSLSQTNTAPTDRNNVYPDTQVDVNEIEKELLSRDHNLPGTSACGFLQPQSYPSKAHEHRAKLRSSLLARRQKNLARRRPVSCDSARPRKRQCSRKNSRAPAKVATPPTSVQPPEADVTPGPSKLISTSSSHQPQDGNENAPRPRRNPSPSPYYFAQKSHPDAYYRKRARSKSVPSRRRKPRINSRRKPSKGCPRKVSAPFYPKRVLNSETSHYCVTPSPGVDSPATSSSPSVRRISSRNSTPSRGARFQRTRYSRSPVCPSASLSRINIHSMSPPRRHIIHRPSRSRSRSRSRSWSRSRSPTPLASVSRKFSPEPGSPPVRRSSKRRSRSVCPRKSCQRRSDERRSRQQYERRARSPPSREIVTKSPHRPRRNTQRTRSPEQTVRRRKRRRRDTTSRTRRRKSREREREKSQKSSSHPRRRRRRRADDDDDIDDDSDDNVGNERNHRTSTRITSLQEQEATERRAICCLM